jgi:hypothetical protein
MIMNRNRNRNRIVAAIAALVLAAGLALAESGNDSGLSPQCQDAVTTYDNLVTAEQADPQYTADNTMYDLTIASIVQTAMQSMISAGCPGSMQIAPMPSPH